MKRPACLFLYAVVVATVYCGSTLADEPGGDVSDCTLPTSGRRVHHDILKELVAIQARCLNESTNVDLNRLGELRGLEGYRAFIKDMCAGRAATRGCLAAEHTKWTSCYNQTMVQLFTIADDLFALLLEKGCADDGANLAAIAEGFDRFTDDYRARNPFVRECIMFTTARWVSVLQSGASISTKIWFFYREFGNFKQCFRENIPEDSLVDVSVRYMDELLDEMKCIHPVDENLVLCKSIDSSLIDRASACPFKTKKVEDTVPMSLLTERRLMHCLVVYEPYGHKLTNVSTLEEYVSHYEDYCRRNSRRVVQCMNETTMFAEICLHDAEYKNYKLEADSLRGALEAGCLEEGRRLANILYTTRNPENTVELAECMAVARTSMSASIEHPSRLNQLYKAIQVARQCVVEKTTGDSTYFDDVNSLADDVMAKMKCFDTPSGDVVPCQTIPSD